MIRTYTELMQIPDFLERFRYLKIGGKIGEETFGKNRYLNQKFYNSAEWRNFRRDILVRDLGCDLADRDHPFARDELVILHHMNPITIDDIIDGNPALMDPENVIATSLNTHNAIHYGDESLLTRFELIERKPFDTCPWKITRA